VGYVARMEGTRNRCNILVKKIESGHLGDLGEGEMIILKEM
jgi:hypothetical protein